jgi:uncharacterized RDD family membrane protein YckC
VIDVAGAAHDRAAYAGFWRRFAAYAIDYAVVLLGTAVLGAAATIAGLGDDAARLSLAALVGYFFYCTLLERSAWQATLGKRALGLKVTNRRGERIGFARAAARFVAKLLSVLTLCLGYLLVLVTARRQALHDLIAGTLVANDASAPRPAWFVSVAACVPLVFVMAGMALPTYRDYTIRAEVSEGLDLANRYRAAIETAWRDSHGDFVNLSSESLDLGLPRRGRYVESIEVVSGMIVIAYGAGADDAVADRVLAIVPALGSARELAWVCGYGEPPAGFAVVFENHASYSDIDERFVPSACRSTR